MKITYIRYHDTSFSLNWFHHVRANGWILFKFFFQSFKIIIRHFVEAGNIRSEIGIAIWVCRCRQRSYGTSPKVIFCKDNGCLFWRYLLYSVTPTPSHLNSSFSCLDSCNKFMYFNFLFLILFAISTRIVTQKYSNTHLLYYSDFIFYNHYNYTAHNHSNDFENLGAVNNLNCSN